MDQAYQFLSEDIMDQAYQFLSMRGYDGSSLSILVKFAAKKI